MNGKWFWLIIILLIMFISIFLIFTTKNEHYTKFSTGDCNKGGGNNKCPVGSYDRSCNVSFNTNDWGENYFTGTCNKDICKDYDGTISNRCTRTDTIKNPVFGYLPSDFFNNPGAYSYDNRGGDMVLNTGCIGEKSNYFKDPQGYKDWVAGHFHDYANIKKTCGDIVSPQEIQPYLNYTCNEELSNLRKDAVGYKSWASNNQDKVSNFILLCPGFGDAFTGYSTDTSGIYKSIFDKLVKEDKSDSIKDGKSIISGDGLISKNKKWMAYLDNDGEFIVYNPESGKTFKLLQTLNINKSGFQGPFKLSMGIFLPRSFPKDSDGFLYLNDKNNKVVFKLGYGEKAPQGWVYEGPFNLTLDDDGKVCIRYGCEPPYSCGKTAYCMN